MTVPRAPLPVLLAPLGLGALWGIGQPLSKIAVEAGWQPWGIIVWQALVSASIAAVVLLARRANLRWNAPVLLRCGIVAGIGTMLPHWASYVALQTLPAGVMAIVLATVPLFALPIATALGIDTPSFRRVGGVCLGVAGVVAVSGALGSDLGSMALAPLAIALIAPLCYAINGGLLDALGRAAQEPLQLLLGASIMVFPAALALALGTEQFRLPSASGPDLAMLAVAAIHAVAYTGLLWLIGRAGAVYAGITGSLVTGFGVIWSMLILSERYPPLVWLGLVLILMGLTLVRPRDRRPPTPACERRAHRG